jgi:hypothetical protein
VTGTCETRDEAQLIASILAGETQFITNLFALMSAAFTWWPCHTCGIAFIIAREALGENRIGPPLKQGIRPDFTLRMSISLTKPPSRC